MHLSNHELDRLRQIAYSRFGKISRTAVRRLVGEVLERRAAEMCTAPVDPLDAEYRKLTTFVSAARRAAERVDGPARAALLLLAQELER